jgi:ABC-type sugar transport system ATPase subunit
VAGFIGSPPMNSIEGTLDGSIVATAAGAIEVDMVGDATDGPVVAGVRPEDVSIGSGGLSATVVNVELLGHERHIVCDVGPARWTIRQPTPGEPIAVGERIGLVVDPRHVHLFDPASTDRLN